MIEDEVSRWASDQRDLLWNDAKYHKKIDPQHMDAIEVATEWAREEFLRETVHFCKDNEGEEYLQEAVA